MGKDPPQRADRRRAMAFLLLACSAIIAVMIGIRLNEYHQARLEYDALRGDAAGGSTATEAPATEAPVVTEPPYFADAAPAIVVPALSPSPVPFYSEKVRGYQRQNSDTVAMIDVLGTSIQYPVVQAKDNDYYMTHSFAKRNRAAGAIFVDAWNSDGFTDFNTVVYGHNMKDASMFSDLREYRHSAFLSEHKYIEVTLLNSLRIYKVFAAYVVEDDFDFRGFANTTQAERGAFIKQITQRSEIKTNTEAAVDDTLLTLVTCTGGSQDWYWIVHAVLVEEVTTAQEP